ncbi:organic cation transporter protein-like [Aplysia californica]|uniref:Organic cation transporter protein-like n=1 Tax=Aplysia californica TaxID=6500 RepID=A0ABM0JYM9_APLCA|nr:organic cation transporter protein-like [Aplysia californica]
MSYDTVLELVGEFGRYQKRSLFLVTLLCCPHGIQVLLTVFTMASTDFRCAVPGLENDTYEIQNEFHQRLINESIPFNEREGKYAECDVYAAWNVSGVSSPPSATGNDRLVTECTSWVYSQEIFTSTYVTQLNLVCGRQILSTHVNMLGMAGLMFGSVVGGLMGDRFGRKAAMLVFIFLHAIGGFCLALVTSVVHLLILRFLECAVGFAFFMIGFTWCMELLGPAKRAMAGMLTMVGWVIGMFLITLMAYFVRDWWTLQLIMSSPTILFLSYYWLIPESPRWLLSKGRVEEAGKIIFNMAVANGAASSLDKEQISSLCEHSVASEAETTDLSQAGSSNVRRIFKSRVMVMRLLILCLNWAVCSMVYYGLTLNVGAIIEGDLFMNFLIVTCMELAAYILCIVALDWAGRKLLYCSCLLLSGCACLATAVPFLIGTDVVWVNVVLSNVGKFGVTVCFAVVYVFTVEVLPTVVRNSGLGGCSFMGRIGSIISPFIANFNFIIGGKLGKVLPLLIFGGSAVIAGFLSLLLPETKGKRLPGTIEEAETFDHDPCLCLALVGQGGDEDRVNEFGFGLSGDVGMFEE